MREWDQHNRRADAHDEERKEILSDRRLREGMHRSYRPDRVSVVPKMHRKKVVEMSTMFQILSCLLLIITSADKRVAVISGRSEAFSRCPTQ